MEQPFEIDFDRQTRLGFPEIIYGASKSEEVLVKILKSYQERGQNALVTKLQSSKIESLLKTFPDAVVDQESGVLVLELAESGLVADQVAIISAGSSDAFVVNEIYYTLAYLGLQASRIHDVGVAGVHRLLKKVEDLKRFKVLIVVAGFEGALPTVVGGLLPQPIVAVPTSVGYGVAEGGKVALNTMLSSCANGISVVNIDNGYGAAMVAYRILSLNQSS
jgi:NCAIR mutase (PurE)-related protein